MKIKYYVFYESAGYYYHFTSVQENKINTYEELENLCKTRWEKKKEENAKFKGVAHHDQQPNESRHWVWDLERKREEKNKNESKR